ncbi:MAG: beta-N-acetylhexosaminidase [Candidatus Lokiarchaeota archaeon]|nr:beta-N-acetylhexosaminidase [Candidatus Lokiarchaeota archaeon]
MIPIIPFPLKYIKHEGSFKFNADVKLNAPEQFSNLINHLNEGIFTFLGYQLEIIHSESSHNRIELKIEPLLTRLGTEGYLLDIAPKSISIQGNTLHGVFYGIQSLLHLILSLKRENSTQLPLLSIEDYPRFTWRGFMLDVGRHYHPVETIKKLLQTMAFLKMNRFHWHLNDDQGWRIEVDEYPKLTSIGSKRKDTQIGGFLSKKYRGIPHEGFYTIEDVREIIQYAQQRYIQVIPEIEIPGHCSAVIASYPEVSCAGNKIDVKIKAGIYKDIYCPGKEETFAFLKKLLTEIIQLFPSNIIHIGGDETPKKSWKQCDDCQARIQKKGLNDEKDLYFYFINRIISFLKSRGKISIGWNQILNESLDNATIIQWWAGRKRKLFKSLKDGRKVIISKISHGYLDYNYLVFPMHRFYNYEPIPRKLEPEYHENVLGVEAALWTEWIPNLERLGWQAFPRLFASAEVGWTQKELKNYSHFKERIPNLLYFLKILKIPCAKMEETDPSIFKRIVQFYKWFKWPKI